MKKPILIKNCSMKMELEYMMMIITSLGSWKQNMIKKNNTLQTKVLKKSNQPCKPQK